MGLYFLSTKKGRSMSEQEEWYYDRGGWRPVPHDDCGYREQADRIDDYQARHTPESVLPFISDRDFPDGYPDGCSNCGKATWWESRELPNGQRQMRCSECQSTLVMH